MPNDQAAAPLSSSMAHVLADASEQSYMRFLAAFREARVVSLTPRSELDSLESLTVGVWFWRSPEAFASRFGEQFNGGMAGEAVLDIVIANAESDGVLVNSASAEVCRWSSIGPRSFG